MEKCVGCFLVYLFLGRFFLLKSVKNCDDVIDLENTLLPRVSVFFKCGEEYKQIVGLVSPKTCYSQAVENHMFKVSKRNIKTCC